MRNKYLYRLYRLRRAIILGTLVGTGLFFLAWLSAAPEYQSAVTGTGFVIRSAIFSLLLVSFQMMLAPRAAVEILKMTLATGLAVVFVALITNAADSGNDAFTKKAFFGASVAYISSWLVMFYSLGSIAAFLSGFMSKTGFAINRSLRIATDAETFYSTICTKEKPESWSPLVDRLENVDGETNKFNLYLKELYWDKDTATAKIKLVQILSEVVSEEPNVSQTVITRNDDANAWNTVSFSIESDENGIIYHHVEHGSPRPILEKMIAWLIDYIEDALFYTREYFEHENHVAILTLDHQPYFAEWMARLMFLVGEDRKNADQDEPWR